MFEIYNEKARRSIFFARYEASQFGSPAIESEHLLLGVFREGGDPITLYLRGRTTGDRLRAEILITAPLRDATSTSVDLPLSEESKHILEYASEEALRLGDAFVGPQHLMLGILREQGCLAANLVTLHGLHLDHARVLANAPAEGSESGFGSGRRFSSDRSRQVRFPMTSVRLIDANSDALLSILPNRVLLPAIGEALNINDAGDSTQSYRVVDVVWNYDRGAEGVKLASVILKVTQEAPTAIVKEDV